MKIPILLLTLASCLLAQLPEPGSGSGSGGGGGATDFSGLTGAATDAQVPDTITITRPITSGLTSALPATCTVGREMYWATDATTGAGAWTVHFCRATNTWVQGGLVAGANGTIAFTCAVPMSCTADVDLTKVPGLAVSNVFTGGNDFSGATATSPFKIGSADPGTCDATIRQFFYNTSANLLKKCDATNTWTALGAATMSNVATPMCPLGNCAIFDGNSYAAVTPAVRTPYCSVVWPQAGVPQTLSKFGAYISIAAGSGIGIVVWLQDYATGAILLLKSLSNPTGQPHEFDTATTYVAQPGTPYGLCFAEDTGGVAQVKGVIGNSPAASLAYANGGAVRLYTCNTSWTGSGATFAPTGLCTSKTAVTAANTFPAAFAY